MSASLVGSEMCIRDRATSRRKGARVKLTKARHAQKTLGHGILGPTGEPVSYTHLTLPTICSV
eukprot:8722318-Alexandrium_andersonii.AAC.1